MGSAEIGRCSEASKGRHCRVGTKAATQSTAAIATPEVDHGSNIATSMVSRSTFRIRAAGSRHADKIVASETFSSLSTASDIAFPGHQNHPALLLVGYGGKRRKAL